MDGLKQRVETGVLLDFYGPLLTKNRQEILRLYVEEDLSLSEIADQLGITRQGVSDAIGKGRAQLEDYEQRLGLARRFRAVQEEAARCRTALDEVAAGSRTALDTAREALENIMRIER